VSVATARTLSRNCAAYSSRSAPTLGPRGNRGGVVDEYVDATVHFEHVRGRLPRLSRVGEIDPHRRGVAPASGDLVRRAGQLILAAGDEDCVRPRVGEPERDNAADGASRTSDQCRPPGGRATTASSAVRASSVSYVATAIASPLVHRSLCVGVARGLLSYDTGPGRIPRHTAGKTPGGRDR
jgi:hypothetical protein